MEAYKRARDGGRRVDRTDASWTGAGTQDSPITLDSLQRDVSPPRKRKRPEAASTTEPSRPHRPSQPRETGPLRSPFQLTAVRDVPASANVDTLTVKDVFGSPCLVECWEFNFLHDLEFLMDAFDEGAVSRGLQVHVVHGFKPYVDKRHTALKQEADRINAELASDSQDGRRGQDASQPQRPCASITLHQATINEPYGTHHTKMAVLFRNDRRVQIVIHTANMIPHDWTNTTQAVWRSPLLPPGSHGRQGIPCVGNTFKKDFLSYLRAYSKYHRPVCGEMARRLANYDFSAIQAVLIASVPGRHEVLGLDDIKSLDASHGAPTLWGWAAMERALREVPIQRLPPITTASGTVATRTAANEAEIVAQVSSIATLGGTDGWLRNVLFKALGGGDVASPPKQKKKKPQFRVVFPTADEIRRSLDGYSSGSSIHCKDKSEQHKKQIAYMNPIMCHWANDVPEGEPLPSGDKTGWGNSGRDGAAPHIKTYIRYAPDGTIDWALMTSANLSKQAWGEAKALNKDSLQTMFRIASYELGVLVWPELLAAGATMQPVFQRDTFEPNESGADGPPVVPLRMPYSLPLQRYGKEEVPWVVSKSHSEPDRHGARWDAPEEYYW